jgi:hypothetical protein
MTNSNLLWQQQKKGMRVLVLTLYKSAIKELNALVSLSLLWLQMLIQLDLVNESQVVLSSRCLAV